MPGETQGTRHPKPLLNEAVGQLLPEDALNWDNSRKEHGAGKLMTRALYPAFFIKGCGKVHLEICRAALLWGLTKNRGLAIHFISPGLQLSHLSRMKLIPATNAS